MCAIFGLLDYMGKLTSSQRRQIIRELGKAAEVRGTDATGIAFFHEGKLHIQKAPRPARRMKYRIPEEVRYIMGHTRMTTQGSARRNQNNHPFAGRAGDSRFALAHNGVIFNDLELRRSLGQRIFGVGSVIIHSSDTTMPTLELKSVKNSRDVKELLYRQVEECKNQRRMRTTELVGEDAYQDADGQDFMDP